MNDFSIFTLNNRVQDSASLGAVVLLLLLLLAPLSVQADEGNATGDAVASTDTLLLDPVKNNSSPSMDPVSQELKKKSGRLRFRDGPLCLCADGLQESDIKKAQQARNSSNQQQSGNGKNTNSSVGE